MMNDEKKSDSAILAMNPANNGPKGPAEPGERRAGAKGNPAAQSMGRAQKRLTMSQAGNRIRKAVKRNPEQRLVALLHHLNPDTLREAFLALRRDAAPGVDGMTWEEYAKGLDGRLADLCRRVHTGAYRAPPSRRVLIPKDDGGKRPLGIASLEDKIVQKVVTDAILVPIFEMEFLGFSYGFRPGRGAHDALDALTVGIQQRKVNWIVDADIRGFFDAISRDWMVRFLEHRIADKRVIRLIIKWLNAGVMTDGIVSDTGRGTPQGAIVSSTIANVYLHYVLDVWFQRYWRARVAGGDAIIVRYADDFVCGFQHKVDAEHFLADLRRRLARFGLELHPHKTRLVEFGRFAMASRTTRGAGKPETFDFLGMTHYCAKTHKGGFRVGRRPAKKRVRRTLRRIKEELYRHRHRRARELVEWLGRVIRGWLNYYAVPGSSRHLKAFVHRIKRLLLRTLRRRSQKDRTSWQWVADMADLYWPRVRILHPWPSQRLIVNTRGRSRMR